MLAAMNDNTGDDIPPLLRPEDMPPVRTQADLWRHWRALMGPLGFTERLLWILFIDADGYVAPTVQQVAELPRVPEPDMVDSLMWILREVCADLGPGSAALLLSRPGRAGITSDERVWAQRLADVAAVAGVRLWPVHLANDQRLVPVTPDDLATPRAAVG